MLRKTKVHSWFCTRAKKVRQGQNWRENLGQIPNICKKSYDRCHCNKLARVLCLPLHAVWTIHIILTRILPIQKDAIGLNNGKLETWLASAPDRKTYAYLNPKYVLCPIIQYISFALEGQCHKIENCYPCLL